jgi:hypothetical protein
MEKFIKRRKPHIKTGSNTDKRILDDSFVAMGETIRAQSVDGKPNTCKRMVQSRITRIAAAVLIIAVGFFVIHTRPRPQTRTDGASQTAKTAGEMLTVLSLNIAYRKGGMDAVEKQYEKAFTILGPRLTSISVQDLLAECNSSWKGQYHEKD